MKAAPKIKIYITEVARIILAATFLFSSIVKAIDPEGTAVKVSEYLYAFGWSSLSSWSMALGILLIFCEFLVGACLLIGVWKRLTAISTFCFLLFFTILTLYSLLYDPVKECGCFGDAIKLTNLQTFCKNIFLLALSVLFLRTHRLAQGAYKSIYIQYTLVLLAIVSFSFFTWQNKNHLPMIDFRPFRVDSKLSDLVLVPEGAPADVITYEFIYEKNGEKKSFSMENLPDESWTFVERKETIKQVGYRPPVTDFALFEGSHDITEQLLRNTSTDMLWIVSPNWEKASKRVVPELNTLYEVAQTNGILCYGISGSSPATTGRWKNATHALYPTLLLDATTCKTMVRGNPAIIFIKNGRIHAKINAKDLLKEPDIQTFVRATFNNPPRHEPYLLRTLPLVVWILITLVGLLVSPEYKRQID